MGDRTNNEEGSRPGTDGGGVDPAVPAGTGAAAPVEGKIVDFPGAEKKRKSRAGTMQPGDKEKKTGARPRGDGKTALPEFDPGYYAEKANIWWMNEKGGGYYVPDLAGNWMVLGKEDLELRLMATYGLGRGTRDNPLGQVERVRLWVQGNRQLDLAMSIAGHRAGVEMIRGNRVLVQRGPDLLEMKKGEWTMLRSMLDGLLRLRLEDGGMPPWFRVYVPGKERDSVVDRAVWEALVFEDEDGVWWLEQGLILFSWLKLAMEVYYRRAAGEEVSRNGQAVVIAGPPGGGKSLLQQYVITPLLGGRMGKPEGVLTGKTDFNKELFAAEHLAVADAPLSQKMEDRLKLGEFIKLHVAEQWHRYHPKGKDAIIVPPVWRMTISINDDNDNIRSLPPMKDGVADKIHLLHVQAVAMPMPTTTLDEYASFARRLKEDLPAMAYWLMEEFEVPEVLRGGRFGMLSFQTPDLMREMYEDSPAGMLMTLLDGARFSLGRVRVDWWTWADSLDGLSACGRINKTVLRDGGEVIVWQGSAAELKEGLCRDECSSCYDARVIFKFHRVEQLMKRLAKEEAARVENYRTAEARLWRVARGG